MTELDLDAIKARLSAATPGPWEWHVRPKRHMLIHRFSERGHLTVLETQGDVEAEYPCANEADRAFIEHAPADLAALIQEVECLRGERAAVVAYLRSESFIMEYRRKRNLGRHMADVAAEAIERGAHRDRREEEP